MMWGAMGYGWIFMVVFWAVIIGLVVWAVTRLAPSQGPSEGVGPDGRARDILDRRFARGEIEAEEYRRLCNELER